MHEELHWPVCLIIFLYLYLNDFVYSKGSTMQKGNSWSGNRSKCAHIGFKNVYKLPPTNTKLNTNKNARMLFYLLLLSSNAANWKFIYILMVVALFFWPGYNFSVCLSVHDHSLAAKDMIWFIAIYYDLF